MRKPIVTLLVALSLMASALGFAGTASAANAPDGCTKVHGTIICQNQDEAGNSGHYKTTTFEKKGSLNSSHDPNCSYTNPGGNKPAGKQGC